MLFFCHKETSLGLLAAAVSMFIISYIMVFLSMYMTKHFKIDKANMGYVFSVMTIPYLLSCAVIPGLIKDCVPRRLQFVISMYGSAIAFCIIGPIWFTYLPDSFNVICAGLFLLGTVQSMTFIPALPEAIDQT